MSELNDRLQEGLAPYWSPDHQIYVEEIAAMWDEFDSYVNMFGEEDVWGPLLDVDRCPGAALPYLGQYMGERLRSGLAVELAREQVKDHAHMRRGTLESIARAAQRTMIGERTVQITERSGSGINPEDYLSVVTYSGETPEPDAVLQDLISVVPADIDLTYTVSQGATWQGIADAHVTWAAVDAAVDAWEDLEGKLIGESVWDRPVPIP